MMNRNSKQIVDGYGIHEAPDGIKWLLEQGGAKNALGLSPKDSVFRIKTHLLLCSHSFNLQGSLSSTDRDLLEYERLLVSSPMLQFFDPCYENDKKVLYIETDIPSHYQGIALAQELLNPTVACTVAADFMKDGIDVVARRLNSSNLATYLIFGMNSNHMHFVPRMASIAMTAKGRLVIAGSRIPVNGFGSLVKMIQAESHVYTRLTMIGRKKLREIGAYRLKKYMRM